MTSWQLYWIARLDSISLSIGTICVIAILVSAALCVASLLAYQNDEVEESAKMLRAVKKPLLVALVALGLDTLVPTTKEMAAIIIVPRVANNEKVQDAANRLYDLAVEWIKELRPSNRNNKETK